MNPEMPAGRTPESIPDPKPERTQPAPSEDSRIRFFDKIDSEDIRRLAEELAAEQAGETVFEVADEDIIGEESLRVMEPDEVGMVEEQAAPPPLPPDAGRVKDSGQAGTAAGQIATEAKSERPADSGPKIVVAPDLPRETFSAEDVRAGKLDSQFFSPQERAFFEEGARLNRLHEQGLIDTRIDIPKDGRVDRHEAPVTSQYLQGFLEKNQLPPERIKVIEDEIHGIQRRGYAEAMRLVDLHHYFKQKGLNADLLAEQATVSKWARLKLAARLAVSSELRARWREYQRLSADFSQHIQDVNDLEWLKKDPRGYAEHQANQMVRLAMLRRQVSSGSLSPKEGGGTIPPIR